MSASPRSLPLVALALAVAVMVAQARVIVGGKTWADTQYHTEIMPPRLAAATAVHGEALPSWWDGTGFGVPLGAEPSHGAWSPTSWITTSPRVFDLLQILLLWWAALGLAVWARRRGAGEPAALVAGLLLATSGVMASAALRGALPALAQLPWLGAAAMTLGDARDSRERTGASVAIGLLLGLIALTGVLAVLVDAIALTIVLAARRPARQWRWLGGAIAVGLVIGAVQWVPAIIELVGPVAGGSTHALSFARLLELIVPGSFGSTDPDHAVAAVAGTLPWAPSLFVGAPLLALAAIHTPARRVLGLLGGLFVAALVVGRGGGWPVWLGAPELHLAVLAVVLAAYAATGLGELAHGSRRATIGLALGALMTAIALGALGALRATRNDGAAAIDRALLDGGLGLVCVLGAIALAWRAGAAVRAARAAAADPDAPARVTRWMPVILALVVAPSIGASPSVFPVADRAIVDDEPAWATATEPGQRPGAARDADPDPRRVFRPVHLDDGPETLDDAIETLAGTAPARWDLDAARSEDPARPAAHDLAWRSAAGAGGLLLDRYGIAFAILPSSKGSEKGIAELARRGNWALMSLPAAPPAAVMRDWTWAVAPQQAADLMFPADGQHPISRGSIVLDGAGDSPGHVGPPARCHIQGWHPGDLDLLCTSAGGWAVVTSTPSPGWHAIVDGTEQPWRTADLLRRAVEITTGTHHVQWTYETPGGRIGGMLTVAGLFALVAMWTLGRRRDGSVTP